MDWKIVRMYESIFCVLCLPFFATVCPSKTFFSSLFAIACCIIMESRLKLFWVDDKRADERITQLMAFS